LIRRRRSRFVPYTTIPVSCASAMKLTYDAPVSPRAIEAAAFSPTRYSAGRRPGHAGMCRVETYPITRNACRHRFASSSHADETRRTLPQNKLGIDLGICPDKGPSASQRVRSDPADADPFHLRGTPLLSNFLTPDELEEWTGYRRRDMIVKQLRRWKVRFWVPADGWPRVHRSVIEGSQGEIATGEKPNLAALRSLATPVDHQER